MIGLYGNSESGRPRPLVGTLTAVGPLQFFSSHDDHLTNEEAIERVLTIVKSFPKVDQPFNLTSLNFRSTTILSPIHNYSLDSPDSDDLHRFQARRFQPFHFHS
ncbi:hypothetical protein SLA2020_311880 [Shorea laevis]